jgi:hypothetical protein
MRKLMVMVSLVIGIGLGFAASVAQGTPAADGAAMPQLRTCRGCASLQCAAGCQYQQLNCQESSNGCIAFGDCAC